MTQNSGDGKDLLITTSIYIYLNSFSNLLIDMCKKIWFDGGDFLAKKYEISVQHKRFIECSLGSESCGESKQHFARFK